MPERRSTAYQIPANYSFGRTFCVGDTDADLDIVSQDEGVGNDVESGYGLDPFRPFATLSYCNTYAVKTNRCDTVLISPGSTYDITTAAGLEFTKNGVHYKGLGGRYNRPNFTCSGTTDTLDINVSGSGCVFENLLFDMTGNDSVTAFLHVTGSDNTFYNCRFLLADSGGQVDIGVLLDTGADRTEFHNCQFYGDTAASFGITINAALAEVRLFNTTIDLVGAAGAGGACCIDFLGAAVNFYAENCFFANRVASATATIDCNAQAVTGALVRCSHVLGTIATAGSGIVPVVSDTPEAYLALIENYVVNDQGGAGHGGEAGALVGSAST